MRGTYFIGYARHWDVTRKLVTNMFTQDDCLLEYLAAEKKAVFLHPIEGTLGTHRMGEESYSFTFSDWDLLDLA